MPSYFDSLLIKGSVGLAVFSLALPFQLLHVPHVETEGHSLLQTISHEEQAVSKRRKPKQGHVAVGMQHIGEVSSRGVLSVPSQDSEGSKPSGLFSPPRPLTTIFQAMEHDKRERLAETESLSKPEMTEAARPTVISFKKPALAMPASVVALEKDSVEIKSYERSVPNVVPSLLDTLEPQNNIEITEKLPAEEVVLPPVREAIVGVAERVEVSSIGIDIAVQPGSYDVATSTWMVDDTSAFHADTTVPVNDTNGATLLYGHARWGIFGNLPDVAPGAEAIVYSKDGNKFVYSFESVTQVDPSDVSMLSSAGKPRLLLQTCSGLFDQHRTIATFNFKEVIKAEQPA